MIKKISRQLIITVILLPGLAACGSKNANSDKITEGIDIGKNSLVAWQKVVDSSEKLNDLQAAIYKKEPVEPVHFQQLINTLPKATIGWSAAKAQGETNSFIGLGISEASRQYHKNDKTIEITVFDWAYNFGFYAPFTLSADYSQETSAGYNKGIKIGNIPGREEFDYQSKDGKLSILVDERFFVQIEGKNLDNAKELYQWWKKVDRQSLTKLAAL